MKKFLYTVLVLLVTVTNTLAAEDWGKFNQLKTADDFIDYANNNATTGRKVLCLVYADYLNNKGDFNSFEDYLNAFFEKSKTVKGFHSGAEYVLYLHSLEGSFVDLQKYQKEAYNHALEDNKNNRYLLSFYLNDKFCKSNNIMTEERFNELVKLCVKYKYGTPTTLQIIAKLRVLARDIDNDDIVIKGFKRVFREYRSLLTDSEDDPILTIVAPVARVLKAYGVDVK